MNNERVKISFLMNKNLPKPTSFIPGALLLLGTLPYTLVSTLDNIGYPSASKALHFVFLVLVPPYGSLSVNSLLKQESSWIPFLSFLERITWFLALYLHNPTSGSFPRKRTWFFWLLGWWHCLAYYTLSDGWGHSCCDWFFHLPLSSRKTKGFFLGSSLITLCGSRSNSYLN